MAILAHPGVVVIGSQANEAPKVTGVACHNQLALGLVSDRRQSARADADAACMVCHGDEHRSPRGVAGVRIPKPATVTEQNLSGMSLKRRRGGIPGQIPRESRVRPLVGPERHLARPDRNQEVG